MPTDGQHDPVGATLQAGARYSVANGVIAATSGVVGTIVGLLLIVVELEWPLAGIRFDLDEDPGVVAIFLSSAAVVGLIVMWIRGLKWYWAALVGMSHAFPFGMALAIAVYWSEIVA
jgi:hypothetical protein